MSLSSSVTPSPCWRCACNNTAAGTTLTNDRPSDSPTGTLVNMPHKDPEARRAYMREWKARNKATNARLNKLADAAMHANRRAAEYGAPGKITADTVRQVLAVGACHYCAESFGDMQPRQYGIDHVQPLHAGGANDPANLVACCHSCNASKWRQDRPGRWSRNADACIACRSAERPHLARQMCSPCYQRQRKHANK